MNVYVDSSVILRLALGEPNPLPQWRKVKQAFVSRLVWVEISRTLERCRLASQFDDDDMAHHTEQMRRLMTSVHTVAVTDAVLTRAGGSFSTVVATLDAIHIVTAMTVQAQYERDLVFATHDVQQGRGARACGLRVVGLA